MWGAPIAAIALYFSAVVINKKTYSLVAVVYLFLLSWFIRGPFILLYTLLAFMLVYRYWSKGERKTVFDRVLEQYPVQVTLLFAGICRGMVARAPTVSMLVESFSPRLARELRQNPVGAIEKMAQASRYPEVKRLVYAETDSEIEHSVQSLVSRLLQAKHTRAMVLSAVVCTLMLLSIEAPLLIPLLNLFNLLGGL